MNFHSLKTGMTFSGIGAGTGIITGLLDQATDVENGIDSNTPQAYFNSVKRHMGYGASIGLGVYGLTHMSSGKIFGLAATIGTGIGIYNGIQNQIYASQHYNGPGYGPGKAEADFESLAISGTRYGGLGLMAGSGIYGGYEVARRIAKGVL